MILTWDDVEFLNFIQFSTKKMYTTIISISVINIEKKLMSVGVELSNRSLILMGLQCLGLCSMKYECITLYLKIISSLCL